MSEPFTVEIEAHKSAEHVSPDIVHIEATGSSLAVRLRGAFITELQLTSPTTNDRVGVLYSNPDLTVPKLVATHIMMPAGPTEGIGGQHGFPRWADYDHTELPAGQDSEKSIRFDARRSGNGLSVSKVLDLGSSVLRSQTIVHNSGSDTEKTSIGEHYYFSLADEDFSGLTVNGMSFDELMGDRAEGVRTAGETFAWQDFNGEATLAFPAGHTVKLSAEFDGKTAYLPLLWIWHRAGSQSICFEPLVGVDPTHNDGVAVPPAGGATLSTKIELL